MSSTKTSSQQISDADFEFVCELMRSRSGICLTETKRSMVQGRLARRVRKLRLRDIAEYLDVVREADPDELEQITNLLTTNLTSFFREEHHFEFLAKTVIPEQASSGKRRLRIWSSACSTGQEPYSIASVLAASPASGWDAKILATDLDSDVLEKARCGEYDAETLSDVRADCRQFFVKSRDGERIRAEERLKKYIRFRQLNLLESWPMQGPFDVIFCRNVLIYFTTELQQKLVDRFTRFVRPGGYLILGHSESLSGIHRELESLGKTVFRRKG